MPYYQYIHMNSSVLCGDVEQICRLCVKYKCTQSDKNKIKSTIIKIFTNTYAASKNMYIVCFLKTKLSELDLCTSLVFHKLICEIFVFLGTINKPRKAEFDKGFEENASYKLTQSIDKETRHRCINSMLKASEDFILWDVVLKNSEHPEYISSLSYLYEQNESKVFLYLAYNTFHEKDLYYSSTIYNKIIIQCMIKLPYLLEENDILFFNIYKTCLDYEPNYPNEENLMKTITAYEPDIKTISLFNSENKNQKKCLILPVK
jgi:hypothetical protein